MTYSTLKEIAHKIGSGATPRGGRESYKESGISLIRSQNILDFEFDYNGLVFIDEEQAQKLKNVIVEENDILLNITGDSVARCSIVPSQVLPARVNQHVMIIRVDQKKANHKYVFYYLQYLKRHLLQLASGGATRNALTKTMIENLEINLIPLEKQKEIANILSSLDDKIENNNAIIANLEEQAQVIFKSWFVDFESFQDEEFVDSELGSVPKRWEVTSLDDMANYKNGLAMQKYRPENEEESLPVLKIKELRANRTDLSSDRCSLDIPEEVLIKDGDIIFSWSGSLLVKIWTGGRAGLNQHLFKVTSKKYHKWFYYYWTKFFLDQFITIARDRATTMGHIKRSHLKEAKILIPNKEILEKMNEVMDPIVEKLINLGIQNKKLEEIRDTLLPKLMSGEIDVGEASEVK